MSEQIVFGKTILIVDDEEIIREVTGEILEESGANALFACDGHEALDCYREHGNSIHIVLLDLMMPRMNGFETYVGLQQMDPKAKVIFSSANLEDAIAEGKIAVNEVGLLPKPYGEEKLIQTLSAYINAVN